MARQGQHTKDVACDALIVVLQLLTTKGIGERTIGRIFSDVFEREEKLADLLSLPAEELANRYRIKPKLAEDLLADNELAGRLFDELQGQSVAVLLKGTPEYPNHLANALRNQAPPVLFAMGNRDLLRGRAVGFCGSRKTSEKGLSATEEYAAALAARKINIISGHARGVDLAAHRAALEAGGTTTIVLAEGILHFNAKSDIRNLLNDANHLVVSTCSPRLPWLTHQAMARNRTICGLSHAMIIVGSDIKGGTFEAGKAALELQRPLFVVSYPQPAPSAAGNKYFLDRGAKPLQRNALGQVNIDGVLEAVERQRENGNRPVPDTQSLFKTASAAKQADK